MTQDTTLDFTMSFCRDKVPGLGEDSFCLDFCDRAGTAGLLGVFDGCGGAGARKNDTYPSCSPGRKEAAGLRTVKWR